VKKIFLGLSPNNKSFQSGVKIVSRGGSGLHYYQEGVKRGSGLHYGQEGVRLALWSRGGQACQEGVRLALLYLVIACLKIKYNKAKGSSLDI
jgi:hypothetical protein